MIEEEEEVAVSEKSQKGDDQANWRTDLVIEYSCARTGGANNRFAATIDAGVRKH